VHIRRFQACCWKQQHRCESRAHPSWQALRRGSGSTVPHFLGRAKVTVWDTYHQEVSADVVAVPGHFQRMFS
jgi:hypothetical protein